MCSSGCKRSIFYFVMLAMFHPPIASGDRVVRDWKLQPAFLMPPPLLRQGGALRGASLLSYIQTSKLVMSGEVNMGSQMSQSKFDGLRGKQSIETQMSPRAGETVNKGAEDNEESMTMLTKIDRGPRKEEKVKVFGARLDSKVASRGEGLQVYEEDRVPDWVMEQILMECNGDLKKAKSMLRVRQGRLAKAEEFFRSGVKSFDNGQYRLAIESFTKAIQISPGGAASREGGQYTIWLGQALDASGQRGKAVQTLRALMSHEDVDVRRVAKGLEYIYTAPQLDLGEEYFQWIDLEKIDVIKGGGKALQYSKLEKMPEKYSLEWYMLQKPKSMRQHETGKDVQVALAGTFIVFAGLFAYSQAIPH
ncbi:hypothetical protein GUITHDRAFT_100135 [Guillardia theta CCMP2712]|uniref:Uncharacterized protein n=1 Tax=Guillardia theta (strain CCMP2712) TaxID=905079 RepID=L1K2H3_GUITC|nr:hypothetical protein GUITHDRAFT_100135 [Guillardia theta CCMP2712]EKX54660.1 hypothetical protein GUITHDRAFT_100135 [Guillardia theta CCMP2712]|eukprot:XP_005841640.1 hypothetical protein GUITHDRAFT_100135 [Guillardia theta CCMP2712]